ncbi:MAG: hypothetical protein CMJ80_08220 [Planctomycetaceae bacterium]|nr:hypothetical protein [Planctomycetaceae bacterium]
MANRRETLFGIDLRSLAAFRIGIGALLLTDLGMRATDLTAHYTDDGIVPRSLLDDRLRDSWRWSWHMLNGSAAFQSALFLVAAFAAAALMVGFRTRFATVVSWLLLVSLHARNPFIVNAGDVLLRVVLFWSIFLPLGAVWSIDHRYRPQAIPKNPTTSVASAAILLQVACMYWMTAYFKWHGIWLTPDGFRRVVELDSYAKPFAYQLLNFPDLLPWMGCGVLSLEICGPILAFSPFATKPIRLLVFVCFCLLHIGIELSLTVGLFSIISILAWILFIPDVFWNRCNAKWPQHLPPTTTPTTTDRQRWIASTVNGFVLLIAIYVPIWNFATVRGSWLNRYQQTLSPFVELTGLRQKWNMFVAPPSSDGWYVAVARLKDGQTVDLLRDGAPADWKSFEKPVYAYRRFPNHRWRKFYRQLSQRHSDSTFPYICRFLGGRWNATHPESQWAKSVELHFMEPVESEAGEVPDSFMQQVLHEELFEPPASSFEQDSTP